MQSCNLLLKSLAHSSVENGGIRTDADQRKINRKNKRQKINRKIKGKKINRKTKDRNRPR